MAILASQGMACHRTAQHCRAHHNLLTWKHSGITASLISPFDTISSMADRNVQSLGLVFVGQYLSRNPALINRGTNSRGSVWLCIHAKQSNRTLGLTHTV